MIQIKIRYYDTVRDNTPIWGSLSCTIRDAFVILLCAFLIVQLNSELPFHFSLLLVSPASRKNIFSLLASSPPIHFQFLFVMFFIALYLLWKVVESNEKRKKLWSQTDLVWILVLCPCAHHLTSLNLFPDL